MLYYLMDFVTSLQPLSLGFSHDKAKQMMTNGSTFVLDHCRLMVAANEFVIHLKTREKQPINQMEGMCNHCGIIQQTHARKCD